MNIGKVIREIRKKKGISQLEFAGNLKKTPTYISLIETDKKTPSLQLLEQISKELEIPVYYFMLKSLDPEKDITPEKRESYEKMGPIISSMIEEFFIK